MKTRSTIVMLMLGSLLISCSTDSTPTMYRLSASVEPFDGGSVTPSQGEFEEGRTVRLTATPNPHWVFDRWEGDYSGTGSAAQIVMDRDKNIYALFTKRLYPLTVEIEGEGTVSERTVLQKSADYEGGTTVELTAVASEGWRFSHWMGDVEGGDNPVTVQINGAITVTAVFEPKEYPLTVTVVGSGSVTEEIVTVQATDYSNQTVVKLTAIPSEGWMFSGWEGDLSGSSNPAQITVEQPVRVTAVFVRKSYTVSVSYDGPGITYIDLISGKRYADGFEYESVVRIRVQPLGGWRFVAWQGDLAGTENPIEVTVRGNITAVAILEQVPFEGEGTISSPYRIATLEQLQMIGEPRFLGYHFIQVADIDATATAAWNDGSGFRPIGFHEDDRFTGTYDGGNFQINGLRVHRSVTYNAMEFAAGLFGFVDHAVIRNVTLEDVDVSGTSGVGGLAGFVGTGSYLENVAVHGSVTGYAHVGGIAGYLQKGEINNATGRATVEGESGVGGLVGSSFEGRINASRAYGNVTGIQNVGGLIGHQEYSKMITYSYARGTVSGLTNVGGLIGASFNTTQTIRVTHATGSVFGNQNTGGLIGMFSGSITIGESFATGNVSSDNGLFIGGLIGRMVSGTLTKAYAHGDVSGNIGIGGLVGRNDPDGKIRESYAAGRVTGPTETGGLIGSNQGSLSTSYWDKVTSTRTAAVGGGFAGAATGLTTAQMTGSNAPGNMPGFDWAGTWRTDTGYPRLRAFLPE